MFNYKLYVALYPDLNSIKNEKDAYRHWIKFGKKEGRICSTESLNQCIPIDFNWNVYKLLNPDLKSINSQMDAYCHWLILGKNEKRIYSFDQLKKLMPSKNFIDHTPNFENIQTIKLNIYYLVEYTSQQDFNSGIQRTVRLLGNKLYNKTNLFLVKLDTKNNRLEKLNQNELKIIEKYDGVPYNDREIDLTLSNKWLFIPEFRVSSSFLSDIFPIAKKYDMKIASIFYDNVLSNKNLFPEQVSDIFQIYLKDLLSSKIDIIFPISKYSSDCLLYHMYQLNCISDTKVIPCLLPGEFIGSDRQYDYIVQNDNKYQILCVSLITKRKNQIALINAINMLQHKYNISLILVAAMYDSYYDDVLKLIKNNPNIKIYHNISDKELKKMYQLSHLVVYPSIEEGFGLPIVESIWNCRPCICMNYGSMKEIATAGCVTIDCNNVNELANTIEQVLTDKELQNKLINEMINAKIKTWDDYANEIVYYLEKF
jgi:glycosyltransferase involved in cell wall biosynthesis